MKPAVIGTGMMVPVIARTLTLGSLETMTPGRSAERPAGRTQLALLAANWLATEEQIALSAAHLRTSADFLKEVSGAELVIESGPENLPFK